MFYCCLYLTFSLKIDNIKQENINQQSHTKSEHVNTNSNNNSNVSQLIYRYHDPNIQTTSSENTCNQSKQSQKTSFVSEFQKSLSIFDYIDFDVPKERSKTNDDDESLESLKYLFNDDQKQPQKSLSRRILRRSTNASSISTDSGYSDIPILSSKIIPVHLIPCTLLPVNVTTRDSMNVCCVPCTCRPPPPLPPPLQQHQSPSSTCLSNKKHRKLSSHSSRSHVFHRPSLYRDKTENAIHNPCVCNSRYYSTTAIYPSSLISSTNPHKSMTKINDHQGEYYSKQKQKHEEHRRRIKTKQASLLRFEQIYTNFNFLIIS